MTLEKLEQCVAVHRIANGQFEVSVSIRNHVYRCKSNNTLAYDALVSYWNGDNVGFCHKTPKQAYMAFYLECKMANGY